MSEEQAAAPEVGDFGKFLEEKKMKFTPLGNMASGVEIIGLEAADLLQACKELKRGKKLNRLNFMTAVETKDGYQSINYLDNLKGEAVVLKVTVPKDNPVVPSLCSVFPTANWQEREAYDMLGINYDGHPNLTRILNPDEWQGHPLRKDYAGPIDELNQPINY